MFRCSPATSVAPWAHRAWFARPVLRPVPGAALVMAALAILAVFGCSVDAPQAPQFETQIFLPLGIRTTTGLDLVDEDGYIQGDSTGAAPLNFVLRGSLQRVETGTLLDMDLAPTGFSFGLGGVNLASEQPVHVDFSLRSLGAQFIPFPPVVSVIIPPFTIESVNQAVPLPESTEHFEWARLRRGLLRITLYNGLPVPLGGEGTATPMWVRLHDHARGTVFSAGGFAQAIAPGATGVIEARLDGLEVSRDLNVELGGGSSGSAGLPVDVRADEQMIGLGLVFTDLVADSVYAVVPGQSASRVATVKLAEDLQISEGLLREGVIRLVVENPYPVSGTVHVTLPSVWRASDSGDPLSTTFPVPAAGGDTPGRGETTLNLAGCVVHPAAGAPHTLDYTVDLETIGSDGPVRLGTRASARGSIDHGWLSFDAIRGRLEGRRFEIPSTETSLDPPQGIDSLSFVSASLGLEITSTVAFPSEAELVVTSEPADGGDSVAVPLRFMIEAATGGIPRVTTVSIDDTNSNILDLIAAHPRKMLVSGSVLIGGPAEGTIRRTDWIQGGYTLSAPLRMRIGRLTHRTDPSSFTISRENQGRIRENAIEAVVRGTVTNHFPAGLEVGLIFAASEADLALDPATHPDRVLALEPVRVAPGETDPVTGRVMRSRETQLEVAIRPDQVPFFARDRLYAQAMLVVTGEDAQRTVELTALDFVQASALLIFRVRVKS
jgi:hypothetical protein